MLKSSSNRGEHEPSWPLRETSRKDTPSTWEGGTTLYCRETFLKEGAFESKGPIEVKGTAASIITCNKRNLAVQNQVSQTVIVTERTTHPYKPLVPYYRHPFLY